MNEKSKPWYLSKGFIGPLITAMLFALRSLGIVDIDADTVVGILYQGTEFAGIIMGMVGRALAKHRLTLGVQAAAPPSNEAGRLDPSREPS